MTVVVLKPGEKDSNGNVYPTNIVELAAQGLSGRFTARVSPTGEVLDLVIESFDVTLAGPMLSTLDRIVRDIFEDDDDDA